MLNPFLFTLTFPELSFAEYHTGTLYLGYFNGPTEGVLIACAIHLISAIFGSSPFSSVPPSFPCTPLIEKGRPAGVVTHGPVVRVPEVGHPAVPARRRRRLHVSFQCTEYVFVTLTILFLSIEGLYSLYLRSTCLNGTHPQPVYLTHRHN